MSNISVVLGDICALKFCAIVNPANSSGSMGGGVALAIKRKGGQVIEDSVMAHAPIAVGSAVLTAAGALPCRFVIHAPTMVSPAERIGVRNVRRAVSGALGLAREKGIFEIAFPGMGTGVGGVDKRVAAHVMVSEILGFVSKNEGFRVVLVGFDKELCGCFLGELSYRGRC